MNKKQFTAQVLEAEKSLYHIAKSILKMMTTAPMRCKMQSYMLLKNYIPYGMSCISKHGLPEY